MTQASPQMTEIEFVSNANAKIDPLYTIFEQHLFNFQDPNADRKTFILAVVKDYLINARKLGLAIPSEWESQVIEELSFQVNAMLAKKIYGCMSINQYLGAKNLTNETRQVRKTAQRRYLELKKAADQAETRIRTSKAKKSA